MPTTPITRGYTPPGAGWDDPAEVDKWLKMITSAFPTASAGATIGAGGGASSLPPEALEGMRQMIDWNKKAAQKNDFYDEYMGAGWDRTSPFSAVQLAESTGVAPGGASLQPGTTLSSGQGIGASTMSPYVPPQRGLQAVPTPTESSQWYFNTGLTRPQPQVPREPKEKKPGDYYVRTDFANPGIRTAPVDKVFGTITSITSSDTIKSKLAKVAGADKRASEALNTIWDINGEIISEAMQNPAKLRLPDGRLFQEGKVEAVLKDGKNPYMQALFNLNQSTGIPYLKPMWIKAVNNIANLPVTSGTTPAATVKVPAPGTTLDSAGNPTSWTNVAFDGLSGYISAIAEAAMTSSIGLTGAGFDEMAQITDKDTRKADRGTTGHYGNEVPYDIRVNTANQAYWVDYIMSLIDTKFPKGRNTTKGR